MSEKDKKTLVATKIKCVKCGKEDFLPFVADGRRKYYCDECLKEYNRSKKKGVVKKVFDVKKKKFVYEFICEKCEKFFALSFKPKEFEQKYYCLDCYDEIKMADKKRKRKNVVLIK